MTLEETRAEIERLTTKHAMFVRICIQQGFGIEDSEDMVQHMFCKGWAHTATYRGEGNVESWLSGILRNSIRQAVRRIIYDRRLYCHVDPAVVSVTVGKASKEIHQFEVRRDFRRLFRHISSKRQRDAVKQVIHDGGRLKNSDHATACAVSAAIKKLRKQVRKAA